MIWILVVTTILQNGTVNNKLYFPNTPDDSTEKKCKYYGDQIAGKEQNSIGTNNGTVYYQCIPAAPKDILSGMAQGDKSQM